MTLVRDRSLAAVQAAIREERQVGVLLQRDPDRSDPDGPELYGFGTVCNVLRFLAAADDTQHAVLQGVRRFEVLRFVQERPWIRAEIRPIEEVDPRTTAAEAARLHLQRLALEALEMLPQPPAELVEAIRAATSPGGLPDLVAAYFDITPAQKQEILETVDQVARMERMAALLAHRIEVLRITNEIGLKTRATLDERQREVVLREQMAAIQRQLGEGEDQGRSEEASELSARMEAAAMPPEVEAVARKELRRFERSPEASPETGILRTHLDWMVDLPWRSPVDPPIDMDQARRILDAEHFGLNRIKRRILEYIAVRKLAPEGRAPILCFVGPPGVGKTSLGRSIAHALGRAFVRVSLGGVHDEAEIRGHRSTYVGAQPGVIVQSLRKAGARNCVMMLDEIDKMGRGIGGDPAAAMLEVLDPEQNAAFRDNYLGVPFDLSRVVFVATANMLETIPGPLLDRMEVIPLAGYTTGEKFGIARGFLVPRQLEANGLAPDRATISDDAVRTIASGYTREAGVRGLEREIGRTFRHAAVRIADGSAGRVDITEPDLGNILGAPPFEGELASRTSVPGVATGLAWTQAGGEILFVEATRSPGKGGLVVTGQLGDVMRESVQAALSLLKNRAASLGIATEWFERGDIHVHVPAGATPKDGPSAGVAMFIALSSLATARPVRSDTAMTGEITLRGLVLPVGGIREKVVAAATAGISRVMLPARNRRDHDEIPEDARSKLQFIWLDRVDQAIDAALQTCAPPTGRGAGERDVAPEEHRDGHTDGAPCPNDGRPSPAAPDAGASLRRSTADRSGRDPSSGEAGQ